MQEIIISIDADGKRTIETKGFRGNACQRATLAFEASGTKTDDQATAESRLPVAIGQRVSESA